MKGEFAGEEVLVQLEKQDEKEPPQLQREEELVEEP